MDEVRTAQRIMHVIVGLDGGGAELMLKRLVESHRGDARFVHEVISLTDMGRVGGDLRAAGVTVRALHMRSPLAILRVLYQLVRMLRARRPDVVQTWMYHADLLGGIAARLAGQRNVIWGIRTTNVEAGSSRATRLVMRLCALLSPLVPHTIVCVADAARKSHAAAGYAAAKMVVIPNGFDVAALNASAEHGACTRAGLALPAAALVVGTVGRFNRAKDHENFVRAAGLLAARRPDVRFVMVGRGLEAGNAQLQAWLAQCGHRERFLLLGEHAQVAPLLQLMDVFCLASRTEGFPNAVGEAMAMRLPCVVTDVGDAAALVGDTGQVVPKEDAARLAEALERMVAMPEQERRALGERARERIVGEFSMERSRGCFEELYQQFAGKKGGA